MDGNMELMAELKSLQSQVTRLADTVATYKQEIAELRANQVEEQGEQGGQQDQDRVQNHGKVDLSPLKPFDIQYFFESKEWKIYLPEGCVIAHGQAATYAAGTDDNDMAVITPAETLWAHVYTAGSAYEFAIDDEAPPEGEGSYDCSVHFRVAKFNPSGTQVMVQHASGVVTVGGREYVCGYNSNITFEVCEDSSDNDRYGKMMIDVYYL